MRFQVPQFIDIEDKIFGPFTFKQFIYLVGGGGLIFVLWRLLPHIIAIPFILPIGVLAGMLAFYKVNNKPFINVLEAYFKYSVGSKLYVWKKEQKEKKVEKEETAVPSYVPKLSNSKLKDISWSLDVLDVNKK